MEQKDLDWLSQHKPFGAFLSHVVNTREQYIADLDKANAEQVLKIAGAISSLDALLTATNAFTVIKRLEQMP